MFRVIHFITGFIIFSLSHIYFRCLIVLASAFDSQGASRHRCGVGGTRFIVHSIGGGSGRGKSGRGGASYALKEWCACFFICGRGSGGSSRVVILIFNLYFILTTACLSVFIWSQIMLFVIGIIALSFFVFILELVLVSTFNPKPSNRR